MQTTSIGVLNAQAQVHFSLRDDVLVIQAQRNNTCEILELIPPEKLRGDLPTLLIEEHVHWLNLSMSVIEIRPLNSLWEQSCENWRIATVHGKYHIYKDHQFLVDKRSRTWAMVSSLLEGLDLSDNLIVTATTVNSPQMPQLCVALPRHGLSFFVNSDGDLESDDFKEMVYDDSQDIGTLFGLVNKLVLRAKGKIEDGLVPRLVLVPHDPFRTGVLSEVQHWFLPSATYHFYKVDAELGYLRGDSSWESKLFLSYLHAQTSIDWRPDPLTGRTGAQEALSILQSAGYQSLRELPGNAFTGSYYKYAHNISRWYPQIIIAATRHSRIFEPNFAALKEYYDISLISGAGRAAYLFPPDNTTRSCSGDPLDMDHISSLADPKLGDTTYTVASMVLCRLQEVGPTIDIVSNWSEVWSRTMNVDMVDSPSPYDGVLSRWNSDLPRVLLSKVQDAHRERNDSAGLAFQLLFLLPTLAFCSSHPQTAFLLMLLAFAKKGQYDPETYVNYKLLDGYSPTQRLLRHHIQASCYREQDKHLPGRDADAVMQCLLGSWPSDTVPTFSLDPKIYNVACLTSTLQALFSSCYHNFKLKEDLVYSFRESPSPASVADIDTRLQYTSARSSETHPASHSYHHKFIPSHPPSPVSSLQHTHECSSWHVTVDQLLSRRPAPVLPYVTTVLPYNSDDDICPSPDTPAFGHLLSSLRMNAGDPAFQEQYIAHLHSSARYVREESKMTHRTTGKYFIGELKNHFVECKEGWANALRTIKESLGPSSDPLEQALARCGQWPYSTAYSLFGCLATTSPVEISDSWRKCLVSFALLLLEFQRARRLLRFSLGGLEEEFSREMENEGCDGWDAEQYPDWLLMQVRTQSPVAYFY